MITWSSTIDQTHGPSTNINQREMTSIASNLVTKATNKMDESTTAVTGTPAIPTQRYTQVERFVVAILISCIGGIVLTIGVAATVIECKKKCKQNDRRQNNIAGSMEMLPISEDEVSTNV